MTVDDKAINRRGWRGRKQGREAEGQCRLRRSGLFTLTKGKNMLATYRLSFPDNFIPTLQHFFPSLTQCSDKSSPGDDTQSNAISKVCSGSVIICHET